MRKVGVFLSVVSVLLLALPVAAQQEPGTLVQVFLSKPKPGMEQQNEQARKRHMEWHRKQNDPWAWDTWQIITGDRFGTYLVAAGGHNWKEFDDRAKMEESHEADAAVNLVPYMEWETGWFSVYLPKFSRAPEGADPPAMVEALRFHLNVGAAPEFIHLIAKIHEAIGKTNWPVNYLWYALVDGGEHPTFTLILPRNKWADFQPPEVSFEAMLEKAFGRQEAESIVKSLNKTIHCQRSEIRRYRPDLSYRPAAK